MIADPTNLWIVLDLETSGPRPTEDVILECAAIAVDSRDLSEVARKSWLVHSTLPAGITPYVMEMHHQNGLWAALAKSPREGVTELDFALAHWLGAELGFVGARSVRLAGNSVQFDHSFLVAHCPMVRAMLSHRIVDVSTLRDIHSAWLGRPLTEPPAGGDAHRAMADAESSLAQLRAFRALLTSVVPS